MKNQRLNTILIALCITGISWNTTTAQERIVQIKDINPSGNSSPTQFTPVTAPENAFYFAATDNINGNELWKSDGTEAGTVLIKNINAGSNSSSPAGLTKFGSDQVMFAANNGVNGTELWKTNGTASGTGYHFSPFGALTAFVKYGRFANLVGNRLPDRNSRYAHNNSK